MSKVIMFPRSFIEELIRQLRKINENLGRIANELENLNDLKREVHQFYKDKLRGRK